MECYEINIDGFDVVAYTEDGEKRVNVSLGCWLEAAWWQVKSSRKVVYEIDGNYRPVPKETIESIEQWLGEIGYEDAKS